MRQFLLGAGAALLAAAGGVVLWSGSASVKPALPSRANGSGAAIAPYAPEPIAEPPAASAKTREEKRFSRYDKDRNGTIGRDEYLAARRKAFAKLDTNGDGRLSFEEYAVKTVEKFVRADADRSGMLTPAEFTTTRVIRKTKPRPDCPPARATNDDDS